MQQRLSLRRSIEIPRFPHQSKILIETGTRVDMLSQRSVLAGGHPEPAHDEAKGQHQHQVRENASDTFRVKVRVAERIQ